VTNQEGLLQSEKATLDSLEVRLKDEVGKQSGDKAKARNYVEAKTRYLQAKRIFDAAQVRYSEMMFERMR